MKGIREDEWVDYEIMDEWMKELTNEWKNRRMKDKIGLINERMN